MIGFAVGALFAPEAYQFFPYFAVAYTSALVATLAQQKTSPEAFVPGRGSRARVWSCACR